MTSIRQTAARVSEAYPLFSVGMDLAYLIREEPLCVHAHIMPLIGVTFSL
jgi:hypothetical protein